MLEDSPQRFAVGGGPSLACSNSGKISLVDKTERWRGGSSGGISSGGGGGGDDGCSSKASERLSMPTPSPQSIDIHQMA